jgi:two-component system cell cycle sensor histidine kinase/response regulator CckA
VDDDESVRTVAQRALEMLGFTVVAAGDGPDAIDLFFARMNSIRLVLLDLNMPRMNGHETFRALRRLKPDVKVILFSGYTEAEATDTFAEMGLAGFLQKPWRQKDLAAKIRSVLGE